MRLTTQGYYNLVVYESEAEDFKYLFERTGEHSDEEVLEWIEEALTYLKDRFADESYSDEDDNLPTEQSLQDKADVLEKMRYDLLDSSEEPFIDPELR